MSGLRAKIDLVPEVTSARAGRRAVEEVLTSWGLPLPVVDDARLVVSELVTNAVVHAAEENALELEVTYSDTYLRISLSDGSSVRPLAREAAADSEGGRGMAIVAAIAERWGVEDLDGGKQIWFELAVA